MSWYTVNFLPLEKKRNSKAGILDFIPTFFTLKLVKDNQKLSLVKKWQISEILVNFSKIISE